MAALRKNLVPVLMVLVTVGLLGTTAWVLSSAIKLQSRVAHALPVSDREPASISLGDGPTTSLGRLNATVGGEGERLHLVQLELELELFGLKDQQFVDSHRTGLLNTVIETLNEQQYTDLKTMGGKLYFKELLVGRMNDYLKSPTIRRIHFNSFYLK